MARRNVEIEKIKKRIAENNLLYETRTDLKFKIARYSIPDCFTIQSDPLYSLPKTLCKESQKKLKKPKASERKYEQSGPAMQFQPSYSALKKDREEFRNRLVRLIMQKDDDEDVTPEEMNALKDRQVFRYYYYIHHGVDTIHVRPLDENFESSVLALIPVKLQMYQQILRAAVEEMKEEYMIAIKKSIVDFVLRDPTNMESMEVKFDTPERRDATSVMISNRKNFKEARENIRKYLHCINPCLASIIDIWYCNFR